MTASHESNLPVIANHLASMGLSLMQSGDAAERARGCNGVRPILQTVPAMAEKLATGVKNCLADEDADVQKSAHAAALLIVQAAPQTVATFMPAVKAILSAPASEVTPLAESLRDTIFATSSGAKAVFDSLSVVQPAPKKQAPSPSLSTRRAAALSFNFGRGLN